jgi:hypothetical protein
MATPASSTPLHISSSLKPRTAEDLTPLQQRQLTTAGESFDGKKLPVATRLSVAKQHEAASFAGRIELRDLADTSGKALYTALLHGADSATVFRAGTTTVVGSLVRSSLDLVFEDALLQKAIEPLLKPKPTAKAPAPKKETAAPRTGAAASRRTKR